jgi:hypothetical protein
VCCDISKLIGQDPESDPLQAIANDFDLSGPVNVHHAEPWESLEIDGVTEQLFQRSCIHNPALIDAWQRFLDREEVVHFLIRKRKSPAGGIEEKSDRFP